MNDTYSVVGATAIPPLKSKSRDFDLLFFNDQKTIRSLLGACRMNDTYNVVGATAIIL